MTEPCLQILKSQYNSRVLKTTSKKIEKDVEITLTFTSTTYIYIRTTFRRFKNEKQNY